MDMNALLRLGVALVMPSGMVGEGEVFLPTIAIGLEEFHSKMEAIPLQNLLL